MPRKAADPVRFGRVSSFEWTAPRREPDDGRRVLDQRSVSLSGSVWLFEPEPHGHAGDGRPGVSALADDFKGYRGA